MAEGRVRGIVYAVDIQQEMLDLLTNKLAAEKIFNVKPVLGTITDPKLPTASVDLILMVDVYHEFDYPFEMVAAPSLNTARKIRPCRSSASTKCPRRRCARR